MKTTCGAYRALCLLVEGRSYCPVKTCSHTSGPTEPWLKRVPSSAWCVRGAVVVQVCLADTVVGFRRLVSKNSQLTTEPERADLGSVLKAHTPGTKCLVPDCQGKFADLV